MVFITTPNYALGRRTVWCSMLLDSIDEYLNNVQSVSGLHLQIPVT